jgi:hypothetical protein
VELYLHSDSIRVGCVTVRTQVRARFSEPVQTDSEAHQATCTVRSGIVSLGVKRSERDVDHPLPSSADV